MPKTKATRSTKAIAPAPYNPSQAKEQAAGQEKITKERRLRAGPDPKERFKGLFVMRQKRFGIGQYQRHRDLRHYVKWPVYVRIQRQRRVLEHRLKVPPALNQFKNTVHKNTAHRIFKLADKYKPETRQEKRARLLKFAQMKAEDPNFVIPPPPAVLKYGINHITALVEQKEARLVLIAHDVDPIEIVVWLPALCRRMGVPYAIVKGKARLGQLVHKKTATAVAFKKINEADATDFSAIVQVVNEKYTGEKADKERRRWGGGILGYKAEVNKKAKAKKDKARCDKVKAKKAQARAEHEAKVAESRAKKAPAAKKSSTAKPKIATVKPLPPKSAPKKK